MTLSSYKLFRMQFVYTNFVKGSRPNRVKLRKKSPSPAGEGRGEEENKIRKNAYLYPPHPNLLPQERRD